MECDLIHEMKMIMDTKYTEYHPARLFRGKYVYVPASARIVERTSIWSMNLIEMEMGFIIQEQTDFHDKKKTIVTNSYEPRCEKTGLRHFRPASTQTGLYSHRRLLET